LAEGSTPIVVASLVGSAAIAAAKYVAAATSGSSALFAEAVHSTVDAGARILILLGMREPTDPPEPGHRGGREAAFWSFVVPTAIFAFGAGVALHVGLRAWADPRPLERTGLAYVVLVAAAVFEAGAWLAAWRRFDRTRAPGRVMPALRKTTDRALPIALVQNSAGLLGLAAAFAGLLAADRLGWLRADAAAALAIAGILAFAALQLAVETRRLLVGEATSPDLLESVLGLAGQAGFVEGVNEARAMHLGPGEVVVNLSVDARDELTAGQVEAGVAVLEAEIRSRNPEVSRVFIEIARAAPPPVLS
jgi:cation diffusion facilitator family transporter